MPSFITYKFIFQYELLYLNSLKKIAYLSHLIYSDKLRNYYKHYQRLGWKIIQLRRIISNFVLFCLSKSSATGYTSSVSGMGKSCMLSFTGK